MSRAPGVPGTVTALGAQQGLLPRGLLQQDPPTGFLSPGVAPPPTAGVRTRGCCAAGRAACGLWVGFWSALWVGAGHGTASILETQLWETRAHLSASGEEEVA